MSNRIVQLLLILASIIAVCISCGGPSPSEQSDQTAAQSVTPPPPEGTICFVTENRYNLHDLNPQMAVINSDGSGYRLLNDVNGAQLDEISDALWSPDASHIAIVAERGGIESIFVTSLSSSSLIKLTDNDTTKLDLIWSPTGDYVAYTNLEVYGLFDSSQEIWIASADGSQNRQLTNSGGDASDPAWSEDGSIVYYLDEDDGVNSVSIDGSQVSTASDISVSELTADDNIYQNFDFGALSDRFHSGGEMVISTPRWTNPQTYLNSAPYFSRDAYTIPNSSDALLECTIELNEYLCIIDTETYAVTIPEAEGWTENFGHFWWLDNNVLLGYGIRYGVRGIFKLDVYSGEIAWVWSVDDSESILISCWDYIEL